MRSLCLLCVLSIPAAAQQAASVGLTPREPDAPRDGVILATVVNTRGEPLAGAWVVLEGYVGQLRAERIGRHASTDSAGRARFDLLPNGTYRPEIRMAGRFFDRRTEQVKLEGPKAEARFDLVLPRKPVLTGRIVDYAGTPMERARVQVFQRAFTENGETILPSRSSSTDDRGAYRIVVDQPGRYWIMASHTEMAFPRGAAPRSTGVAFFPNSPDLLAAAPIDLAFDQPEQSLDITLPPAPPTALTVAIVSGPAGKPCAQCSYSLRKVDGSVVYEIIRGGTGEQLGFSYSGIPAGQYRVYVQDSGANADWWAIGEAIVVEGRPSEALVATQPPIIVSGKVTLQDPPSDLAQPTNEIEKPIGLNLVQETNMGFFGTRGRVQTDAQLPLDAPAFSFGPIPPGTARFHLWMQRGNGYLAGISRAGRPLESAILDLAQPGPWTDLELIVRFDPAQPKIRIDRLASGNVEGQQFQITLLPDAPFGGRQDAPCAAEDVCYVNPVPPGRYRIVATAAASAGRLNFHDPKVWERLSPWARTVTLTPGENPTISLTPAPN